MNWLQMNRHDRMAVIRENWDKDCSATTMAEIISRQTNSEVSKHSILGTYHRNAELKRTHPLGGGGRPGSKQLYNADGTMVPRTTLGRRKNKTTRLVKAQILNPAPAAPVISTKKYVRPAEYVAFDDASLMIDLEHLGLNQCHFSVNEPDIGQKHLFCGFETEDDHRYCPHHQARTIKGGKPWPTPKTSPGTAAELG